MIQQPGFDMAVLPVRTPQHVVTIGGESPAGAASAGRGGGVWSRCGRDVDGNWHAVPETHATTYRTACDELALPMPDERRGIAWRREVVDGWRRSVPRAGDQSQEDQ